MSTETTDITQNVSRVGNFTSSAIVALTTKNRKGDDFGEAANTYITEKIFERILGCSIDTETDARATSWGKCLEMYVFTEVLDTSYTITSQETDTHPTIPCWRGSKDGTHEGITAALRAVIDIKCPFTKKSYMQLILPLFLGYEGMDAMNALRFGFNHKGRDFAKYKEGEKYYMQLVSNAIINNCNYAELIIFMPKDADLINIRNYLNGNPKAKFLEYLSDNQIPSIPDNSPVKSLYVIRFEVPKEDITLLTNCVLKAQPLLTEII